MKLLKFLGVLCLTIAFSHHMSAQTNKEEMDLIQSIFGMEKKAIVAEFIDVDSSNPFWAIYDEYETKRKDLGKERIAVLMNYVENYNNLDNASYDKTIVNMISLRKSTDKLIDQYYGKIKKASGSKVAAQFFQLENYFLSQIRSTIFEEIPYIGEFEN